MRPGPTKKEIAVSVSGQVAHLGDHGQAVFGPDHFQEKQGLQIPLSVTGDDPGARLFDFGSIYLAVNGFLDVVVIFTVQVEGDDAVSVFAEHRPKKGSQTSQGGPQPHRGETLFEIEKELDRIAPVGKQPVDLGDVDFLHSGSFRIVGQAWRLAADTLFKPTLSISVNSRVRPLPADRGILDRSGPRAYSWMEFTGVTDTRGRNEKGFIEGIRFR